MVDPAEDEVVYLTLDDFVRAAVVALGTDPRNAKAMTDETLAGSALAAPAAAFGDHIQYPEFASKVAVLLQAVASNHSLPDGNKRTALLCAILFANLNGFRWEPPAADDPDGVETGDVVEAAAARAIPLAALRAWVSERLHQVNETAEQLDRPSMVIYPAEFVGPLPYEDGLIRLGDLTIADVHGYNPAGVYVRRITGKTEGVSVAEIIISVVGDGYAQEELDAENEEALRYPLGVKEFWRARMVGKYRYGPDSHLLTDEEFEADWAESDD